MYKAIILWFVGIVLYAETYSVSHVKSNDTLSVRSAPGAGFEEVGTLGYDAKHINVLECTNLNKANHQKWCRIIYESSEGEVTEGWVNNYYLTPNQENKGNSNFTNEASVEKVSNIDEDYVYSSETEQAIIDSNNRWIVISNKEFGTTYLYKSYNLKAYEDGAKLKGKLTIFINPDKKIWNYTFNMEQKTDDKNLKVTSYSGIEIEVDEQYIPLKSDTKRYFSRFRKGKIKTTFTGEFHTLDNLELLKHGSYIGFVYYSNNERIRFTLSLNNSRKAIDTALRLLNLKENKPIHGEDKPVSKNDIEQSKKLYIHSDKEEVSVKYCNEKENKKPDRIQRKKVCLNALEHYFVNEVPHEALKQFFLAQYEITVAKSLAIIFQIYLHDAKEYSLKKTAFAPTLKYRDLVRNRMLLMDTKVQSDSEFAKAKKSFLRDPFSVKSFVRILKFLSQYADDENLLRTEYGANFTLDVSDFKMLDILIAHEKQFGNKSVRLMTFLEHIHEKFIYQRDMRAMEKVSFEKIIKPNEDFIKNFLEKIKPPAECKQERKDLMVGDANCLKCYQHTKDNLYTLYVWSNDVVNTLFQSLLKRTDLDAPRREKLSWPVFYYGVLSPWGSVEEGTDDLPKLRADPEDIKIE